MGEQETLSSRQGKGKDKKKKRRGSVQLRESAQEKESWRQEMMRIATSP